MSDACRSCGEPIEWGITSKGKRIPLDLGTVAEGNVRVVGAFREAPAVEICRKDEPRGTRRSHFASCPDAKEHRR